MRRLKPFQYIGGKGWTTWHDAYIPYGAGYCEPFCGSCAVFLRRRPSRVEVLNDINRNLVNFFRVLQDTEKRERLLMKLVWSFYGREEFTEAKERLLSGEGDDVERAYWYFIRMRQSYGGRGQAFGYCFTRDGVASYWHAVANLVLIANRLQHAIIENVDWEVCVRKWDKEGMVFYIDPPYFAPRHQNTVLKTYGEEGMLSEERHRALIEWCLQAKGAIVIVNYDNELYRTLEREGWERIERQICINLGHVVHQSKKGEKFNQAEVLWRNRQALELERKERLDLRVVGKEGGDDGGFEVAGE